MNAVLDIISHEYRKYVFTRGFILFLLLIPFAMVFGAAVVFIQEATESAKTFVVIDRSTGGYEEVIRNAVEDDREERVLRRYDELVTGLGAAGLIDVEALEDPFRPGEASRARRKAFFAAGGLEEARRRIDALSDTELPAIEEPRLRYRLVELDPGLPAGASADLIGEAYAPYMRGDEELPDGGRLTGVVLIPEDFAEEDGGEALYLTDNLNDDSIASFIRSAISEEMQRRQYLAAGLSDDDIIRVQGLSARVRTVKAGTGAKDEAQRRRDRIETLLPFGLAYILFFGAFSVGSMLLTNTIEEKSNKIVEMLLSSVSAWQLMIGKLIALALVGLTPLAIFGAVGIALLTFFGAGDEFAGLVRDVLLGSPLVPFFFIYFVLGYLLIGAVYLGIGALCETIQDAQNLSTPLTFIVLLPTFALVPGIIDDPNGMIAKILTWIPLYSHVVMMLRLSSNPPMWEIIGGTVVLAATALLLIGFMGRIYRAGILQSGGNATWKGLMQAARASREVAAK